jgi:hypothetical protein
MQGSIRKERKGVIQTVKTPDVVGLYSERKQGVGGRSGKKSSHRQDLDEGEDI